MPTTTGEVMSAACASSAWTTATGHCAWCKSPMLTEPSNALPKAPMPRFHDHLCVPGRVGQLADIVAVTHLGVHRRECGHVELGL